METSCHNLPGISEVRFIPLKYLQPYIVEKVAAGVPVAVERDRSTLIRVFGNPSCITEATDSNNGRIETATLKLQTLAKVPSVGVAFLVRQASGQWFLLGSSEKPPVVSVNYNTGEMSGEAAVNSVTVTFTALKALIPVAV